jgi:chromosomal replication initiator protein
LPLPANVDLIHAWREIRDELRRIVGDSTFEIWLASLEAHDFDGRTLSLRGSSDTRSWVSERYGRAIETSAATVLGDGVRVAFDGLSADPVRSHPSPSRGRRGADAAQTSSIEATETFNPRYSFDQFVIGDGNRLAHAASLAVSELPGQAYNPLFLHAPPGLGKTHLLHAIGNYVVAFGGGTTVRYTTVESFTNHFISALSTRSLDHFKRAYRDADVLLIDDVQFLASKAKTEEEFFHTFNALYETGRQLVLTCDRLPRELVAVEERLRERFESGLVADIQPPDYATRLAILRKRAVLDHVSPAQDGVLELIAHRVSTNVRALEGALIRVVAYHSLTRRPIDLELTVTVLDSMYPETRRQSVSIGDVQATVAAYFGVTVAELNSQSRASRVSWPRQLAMHLARDLTHASLPAIGAAFGGRNHATVHYACRKVSDRLVADPEASTAVHDLTDEILGNEGDRPS